MCARSLRRSRSHPTRVRGLKPRPRTRPSGPEWRSHPTRVRGLKPAFPRIPAAALRVAPHAGAWIETAYYRTRPAICPVAPHAGAWIETSILRAMRSAAVVAPHAGAWIETFLVSAGCNYVVSHPTRVRGLKLIPAAPNPTATRVAPHAGAWIETRRREKKRGRGGVAPHAGAWIETRYPKLVAAPAMASHPTRVRGLKPVTTFEDHEALRRTPRGCVD